MMREEIIVALATPMGRSGVAIVRIDGARGQLASLVENMCGKKLLPRQAELVMLKHPQTSEILDHALALFFESPQSFTGNDVLELHVHGSPAIVHDVIQAVLTQPNTRIAEAGEFTRRALMNQKLDLTGVEALDDLIHSDTSAQRKQALRQLQGQQRVLYESWRQELLSWLAQVEAYIDFPDEDLPQNMLNNLVQSCQALHNGIAVFLDDQRRGERLRVGARVVIVGAPNAGKSSLFNALLKRDAAIVSARPGTTRDVLEAMLDIDGWPVVLVDTAGQHSTDDEIEEEGIRRAKLQADAADVVLFCLSPDANPPNLVKQFKDDPRVVWLFTKSDQYVSWHHENGDLQSAAIRIAISQPETLQILHQALAQRLVALMPSGDQPMITRLRHRQLLTTTQQHLSVVIDQYTHLSSELVAEELRLAMRALGQMTGVVDVEEMLDVVFSRFCIGK